MPQLSRVRVERTSCLPSARNGTQDVPFDTDASTVDRSTSKQSWEQSPHRVFRTDRRIFAHLPASKIGPCLAPASGCAPRLRSSCSLAVRAQPLAEIEMRTMLLASMLYLIACNDSQSSHDRALDALVTTSATTDQITDQQRSFLQEAPEIEPGLPGGCPGGTTPQCVACSGTTCVDACTGGFVCNPPGGIACGVSHNCRSGI
jgi:hypothetical protein